MRSGSLSLHALIAKMRQIEQHAGLTLREYPDGWVEERQRLIAAIAAQVRGHFEAQRERRRRLRSRRPDAGPGTPAENGVLFQE